MCLFSAPKIKPPPPPAQLQAMQSPKDLTQNRNGSGLRRRRGLWATVFTGPQGITGAPSVTGTAGGLTGG